MTGRLMSRTIEKAPDFDEGRKSLVSLCDQLGRRYDA
jgi:hypothetical protein